MDMVPKDTKETSKPSNNSLNLLDQENYDREVAMALDRGVVYDDFGFLPFKRKNSNDESDNKEKSNKKSKSNDNNKPRTVDKTSKSSVRSTAVLNPYDGPLADMAVKRGIADAIASAPGISTSSQRIRAPTLVLRPQQPLSGNNAKQGSTSTPTLHLRRPVAPSYQEQIAILRAILSDLEESRIGVQEIDGFETTIQVQKLLGAIHALEEKQREEDGQEGDCDGNDAGANNLQSREEYDADARLAAEMQSRADVVSHVANLLVDSLMTRAINSRESEKTKEEEELVSGLNHDDGDGDGRLYGEGGDGVDYDEDAELARQLQLEEDEATARALAFEYSPRAAMITNEMPRNIASRDGADEDADEESGDDIQCWDPEKKAFGKPKAEQSAPLISNEHARKEKATALTSSNGETGDMVTKQKQHRPSNQLSQSPIETDTLVVEEESSKDAQMEDGHENEDPDSLMHGEDIHSTTGNERAMNENNSMMNED